MDKDLQTQALLTKLETHSRQQLLFTKVLCILCALALVCSVVIMVTVCKTASALTELIKPVQELAVQAEATLTDLDTAASKLAQADFSGMVSQINTLAADSQAAVGEAVKKMDALDIETLNKAIRDLAAAVEPLANAIRFFG